jgi:tRNA pseudouridine55 synthase
VGVEKATRLLGYLTLTEKEYAATIRLGQSTSTDDAEGEPIRGASARGISREALDAGIARLTGEISQVPPGVSAIKVGGQRAYKLTRAGAAPDLAARQVTVYEFAVGEVRPCGDFLDVDARIRCSSGTYIRALARDLGAALGTGGHLTALRRTAVGPYRLQQAHSLEDLSERMQLTPLAEAAAAAFPRLDLTADDAQRLSHGVRIPVPPRGPASQENPPPAPGAVPGSPGSAPPAPGAVPGSPGSAPAAPGAGRIAPGTAPATPRTPMAAFAPDGTLVALVTEESGRLRSLAVFADPPRAAALGPGGDG